MSHQGPALMKSDTQRPGSRSPVELRPARRVRTPEADDDAINVGELVAVVLQNRGLIAVCALLGLLAGGLNILTTRPVFRADALVQVEEKNGGLAGLEDVAQLFGGESAAETEIELIRSRSVLGETVEGLRLDVKVTPIRFPLFGDAVARFHKGGGVARAFLGLERFAWGGERLRVKTLQLPPELEGQELTLVANSAGLYTLRTDDGEVLVEGRAGQPVSAGPVTFEVTELRARPGTEFRIVKVPWTQALEDFRADLQVAERTKKSGIIELNLDGEDPDLVRAALDSVAHVYVRHNVERKTEEAEKMLAFIKSQLPLLRSNLDTAEVALNAHRSKSGTVDLSVEARAMVDHAAELEAQVAALEMQRSELRQRFTDQHQTVLALDEKLQQLRSQQSQAGARMRKLPSTELTTARLMRDTKVANELYMLLLNRSQELSVLKSGTVGNVRVVDAALLKHKPIRPKRGLLLAGSLAVGLGIGIGLSFARRALNRGFEDPAKLEQELGLPVLSMLPHSDVQLRMVKAAQRRHRPDSMHALASIAPQDLVIESLRSLRTSLQMALLEAGTNVITVGGPRPGVGKSFVSLNLAHVLADAGKRVLLVDADMRRGELHRFFGLEGRGPGLAEALAGHSPLESVTRTSRQTGLDFVPTGEVPANPSELLAGERFRLLLQRMQATYDLVILDAPPILAVTDGALLGREGSVNLMVLKAGVHPARELDLAIGRMERSGARVHGFVLNEVPLNGSGYGSAYQYQYDYR